ncbi:MAG: DUF1836 domain-containing protein [Clostridium sp.]|uniref:DUF1836 domain-containing protein n=1 Tax=Clostridium sp. TaxID=1506 RepID=UPI003072DB20
MKFDDNELVELFLNLNLNEEIELNKIPDLDLYMDQVIQLFENNLSNSKRNESDKILTKTMINNYSKDKLLFPTKNKKYTKEHIILMIMTYDLKQTLSIGDIKKIFNPMVEGVCKDDNILNISELYEKYLILKNKQWEEEKILLENTLHSVSSLYEDIDGENNDINYQKLLSTILALLNSAALNKRLAEKIIDKYF